MHRCGGSSPISRCRAGCHGVDERWVISWIIFVIRNGLRWRDTPTEDGPHKTIYNRFIRWSRLGLFNKIFEALTARGISPCIPSKTNRKVPIPHDRMLYR
jgi:transposase